MKAGLWIIFGGMALFGLVVFLIDLNGRRHERKEETR